MRIRPFRGFSSKESRSYFWSGLGGECDIVSLKVDREEKKIADTRRDSGRLHNSTFLQRTPPSYTTHNLLGKIVKLKGEIIIGTPGTSHTTRHFFCNTPSSHTMHNLLGKNVKLTGWNCSNHNLLEHVAPCGECSHDWNNRSVYGGFFAVVNKTT